MWWWRRREGKRAFLNLRQCRSQVLALCALAAASFVSFSCFADIRERDDRGRELVLAYPASRIVSLAPHLTELLFAAGAGEKVVGASRYSDYPEAAKQIPQVGDAYRVDLERMVALDPDLIVGWKSGNPPSEIARLDSLGFSVFVTEPRDLSDIPRLLQLLARLAGTEDEGKRAAREFERELSKLRMRYSQRERLSVFYQIWEKPLMTINSKHIINDVIEVCGGVNAFADLGLLSAQVSIESALARDPQVIIDGSSLKPSDWSEWKRFPGVDAVANGNLYHVPPDLLHRASPRILKGAEHVCEVLDRARWK